MYREQIEAYFDAHQEDMVRDIMDLVSIRSVDGEALPGKPFGEGPAAALDAALAKCGPEAAVLAMPYGGSTLPCVQP